MITPIDCVLFCFDWASYFSFPLTESSYCTYIYIDVISFFLYTFRSSSNTFSRKFRIFRPNLLYSYNNYCFILLTLSLDLYFKGAMWRDFRLKLFVWIKSTQAPETRLKDFRILFRFSGVVHMKFTGNAESNSALCSEFGSWN